MDALPYYKWLWRDWRSNRRVQRMPWQAKGLYRELLDEFWAEGSLPSDLSELADICGCSEEEMQEWWPYIQPSWEEIDGRLYNAKMNEQRTAKDAERVAKADSGRIGGKASNSLTRAQELQAKVKDKQASAKQVLASAKQFQAQPDIAEQSISRALAEQEQEHIAPSANALEAIAASSPAIGTIPLVDGSNWQFTREDLDAWAEAFPAVDVLQQLREMREWCKSNPTKRKTKRGIRAFVTQWLGKEQDKGGFPRNERKSAVATNLESLQRIAERADRLDGGSRLLVSEPEDRGAYANAVPEGVERPLRPLLVGAV